MAFSCFTYWLGLTEASYKRVIELTICGYPYPHMWYMYMCIGLYLATPVIWKIKEGGGEPWKYCSDFNCRIYDTKIISIDLAD